MKFNFDIECTPEEARKFFGLPDVIPLQDALMQELQDKMSDNISKMDPETLARTWLPAAFQNFSDMQKMFWEQVKQSGLPPMPPGFGMPMMDDGLSDAPTQKKKPATRKSHG